MWTLFRRASWPALALIVPEVFGDTFEWLRKSHFWAYVQGLVLLWMLVAVVSSIEWTALRSWGINHRKMFVGLASLIGAVVFGSIAFLITRPASAVPRPPEASPDIEISWKFDELPPLPPVLGLASSFGEEPYVYLLQFYGKNNTNERFDRISGFVQSRSSDTRLPVGINVSGTIFEPDQTAGIPAGAEFAVMTWPLPSNMPGKTGGMTVSRFLVDFAEFSFVFNYNGQQYTRIFTNSEILKPIEQFARDRAAEAAKQIPRVQLREKTDGKTK